MGDNELETSSAPAEATLPAIKTTQVAAEALPFEATDTATEGATAPQEAAEVAPLEATATAAETLTVDTNSGATEVGGEALPLEATDTAAEVATSPKKTAESLPLDTTTTAVEGVAPHRNMSDTPAEVVSPHKETTEVAAKTVPHEATNAAGLPKRNIFGPPPLIPGENAADYEAFRAAVWAAVEPKDALEEIWLRDIVDGAWEARRMLRLKASFLHVAAHEGLEKILLPLTSSTAMSKNLSLGWMRREPKAAKEVAELLASAGLTIDAVIAQTLVDKIDSFDRMNRIGAGAESRRNLIPREIDRHRAAVATALKEKAQKAYPSLCKK